MIIQHDLPLPPEAMGGPVLDINGKAIGLNMARVDRVTTYALTAKIVQDTFKTVSYTHLRAHETPEHLVCRLLLEKKKTKKKKTTQLTTNTNTYSSTSPL